MEPAPRSQWFEHDRSSLLTHIMRLAQAGRGLLHTVRNMDHFAIPQLDYLDTVYLPFPHLRGERLEDIDLALTSPKKVYITSFHMSLVRISHVTM